MVHLKSEKKIKEMEKSYNIHVKNYKKDNSCSHRNDRIRVKSIPLEWFSVWQFDNLVIIMYGDNMQSAIEVGVYDLYVYIGNLSKEEPFGLTYTQ